MPASDELLPESIHPYLKTRCFGKIIHHYLTAGSTNDLALQLAEQGAEEGTLILAEEQTQGRGRLGRSWFSEKHAGIYASLVLRPRLKPHHAAILTLAAAVAASEAIECVSGLNADIKWPNDLLVNERKCCGILSEMQAQSDSIRHVILGIGINVNHSVFPENLREQASSLFLEGKRRYSRLELLCTVLKSFEALYDAVQTGNEAAIVERWIQRSSFASGKAVTIDLGGKPISGVTAGLGETGTLKVKLPDGQIEEIMSGDIVKWR
jgi:BirA family biotin operon repressor/biotin-[acetyl-CoA-carboxylase] ligase